MASAADVSQVVRGTLFGEQATESNAKEKEVNSGVSIS